MEKHTLKTTTNEASEPHASSGTTRAGKNEGQRISWQTTAAAAGASAAVAAVFVSIIGQVNNQASNARLQNYSKQVSACEDWGVDIPRLQASFLIYISPPPREDKYLREFAADIAAADGAVARSSATLKAIALLYPSAVANKATGLNEEIEKSRQLIDNARTVDDLNTNLHKHYPNPDAARIANTLNELERDETDLASQCTSYVKRFAAVK